MVQMFPKHKTSINDQKALFIEKQNWLKLKVTAIREQNQMILHETNNEYSLCADRSHTVMIAKNQVTKSHWTA